MTREQPLPVGFARERLEAAALAYARHAGPALKRFNAWSRRSPKAALYHAIVDYAEAVRADATGRGE